MCRWFLFEQKSGLFGVIVMNTRCFILGILSLAFTVDSASATTFDFVAYAAGNEHAAVTETFTQGGLSLTASGRDLSSKAPFLMYLDDLSGGNPGGLSVCQNAGPGECVNPGDDSIGANEVLRLDFNTPVSITEITFSNGEHFDIYNGNFGLAIDSTPTTTAGFAPYLAAAVFNTPLFGTSFSFISNASFSGSDVPSHQLYISSITATSRDVPEPATVALLGLGSLFGIACRRRRV